MKKNKSILNNVCFTIFDMAKQTFHEIEKIAIDIVCRRLVEYYDNKNGKTALHLQVQDELSQIKKEFNTCQEDNKQLQDTIITLQDNINNLSIKLNDVETVRDELIETNEIFAQNIQELRDTIASFSRTKAASLQQEEKQKVQDATNSEETRLSCLYAEPDATGAILRKPSTSESKYSLYKLEISESNDQLCAFSALNNEATETYIANRNVSLQACQILEIAANPTTFVTIEPGTAVKENNNWVVASPAKIKIV